MSYLSPTNSLDDIEYDEMEDVTDVFERYHLDGNGDYHGNSGEDSQMSVDQGPYDDAEDDYSDLPSVLIVTGVPDCVYDNQIYRDDFESLFKAFEPMPEFYYLKCFRRARVVYESSNSATQARIQMHEKNFHGSVIKCYFAQMPVMSDPSSSSPFLLPPKPDKQFLISPPSSPPVGWESVSEKEPVINYDLLAAIANLAPGESHEIHAASDRLPGIVVHVCEDPEGFMNRPRMLQTSCPYRMS